MTKIKPAIPSGTRDFGPAEVAKRNYIVNTIRKVYAQYGYAPLETPAMENLSTLLGKYGEEGDKLLYKILNSGDWAKALKETKNSTGDIQANTDYALLSEKGLRYDLTVPFARYVVMHRNDIAFPFRRYQVQPVWRADRPQKGRYREFWQCDADVIGSDSLLCDAEMVFMIRDVFTALHIPVTVRLNNRKILDGLAAYAGAPDKYTELITVLDKLDKIGADGVVKELQEQGFSATQIGSIQKVISLQGTLQEKLQGLKALFAKPEIPEEQAARGIRGLEEIGQLFDYLEVSNAKDVQVEFDLTLARGLSYYTGTIYEVHCDAVKTGSILGGGRYDDLTGIFGMPGMSGVGISFGLDRIYDVLEALQKFPESALSGTKVLLIPLDAKGEIQAVQYAHMLHREDISAELYPDTSKKLDKKFRYANERNIPYVLLIGEEELAGGNVSLRNMRTGTQEKMHIGEVIEIILGDASFFLDVSE